MKEDDWEMPESELGKQLARASLRRAKKETDDMARKSAGVQQELIEDARQTKRLPAKLRNKLAPLCEAEEAAGSNRLRATELLKEIQDLMADLEIPQLALPNGGKVIYTEKKAARYVAPKKSKVTDDDSEESTDDDDDESDDE